MSAAAPFSTLESRTALEQLKEFVRVNAPAGKIEAHAFRYVSSALGEVLTHARARTIATTE
jgi:hypothetical protein